MKLKMSSKVIADTCIWVEFLRSKSEISNRLRDLISINAVASVGIIIAELLQGTRSEKERRIIVEIFESFESIEMTKEIWIETGMLANNLRLKGKTVPLSDIAIACCAKKKGYKVFTIDKHFQIIPDIEII